MHLPDAFEFQISASDIEETIERCPYCDCAALKKELPLRDDPEIWLLGCPECKARFASHLPSDEVLERFYARYYDSPIYSPEDGNVHFADPCRFASHLERILPLPRSGSAITILDFGGGDGAIAAALAERVGKRGLQANVVVVDYGSGGVATNRAGSIERVSQLSDVQQGLSFEVVVASASLEHVKRPHAALRALLDRLSPGGSFYARTPDALPMIRLAAFFGRTSDFGYPAHLHDMGQPFWERVLESLGLVDRYSLVRSRPSIVESTLSTDFARTLGAHLFKSLWLLLRSKWRFVGGWEVVIAAKDGGRP